LNKETEDGYDLWNFKEILDHHVTTKNGKSVMEVKVLYVTQKRPGNPLTLSRLMTP